MRGGKNTMCVQGLHIETPSGQMPPLGKPCSHVLASAPCWQHFLFSFCLKKKKKSPFESCSASKVATWGMPEDKASALGAVQKFTDSTSPGLRGAAQGHSGRPSCSSQLALPSGESGQARRCLQLLPARSAGPSLACRTDTALTGGVT